MFDPRGPALNSEERELLRRPATGGVILFKRNYENPEQIAGLVAEIRAERPGILIAVDHEGGRVQRFREGFTRLPPAARYAERFNGEELLQTLETAGWLMAIELRSVGVDFSFAPVLDVDIGISEIIGDRSFSSDPRAAGDYALAFARGMRRAGMAAVGKHFPGHGAVALDSHLALPVDPRPYAEILERDLPPFKTLIEAGLEGVMPAHVVYPEVDEQPAGFSKRWIGEVLRRELGFQGAAFSDDLSMEGAAGVGGYVERARLAIEAGCDMVLACNNPEAAAQVLDALENLDWRDRQARLRAMRGAFPVDRAALSNDPQWRAAAALMQSLAEDIAA
jgi:beta-N-acetylhexosaminidase